MLKGNVTQFNKTKSYSVERDPETKGGVAEGMREQMHQAMVDHKENDGFDVSSLIRNFLKYRWMLLASLILFVCLAGLYTSTLTKIYQASCVVEYGGARPRPLGNSVEEVTGELNEFWSNRDFLDTQNWIISSRLIAERVVRKIRLHENKQYLPKGGSVTDAAEKLRANLKVESIEGTRLVQIKMRDEDPKRAALISNEVAREYKQLILEEKMSTTVDAVNSLAKQLDQERAKLLESEDALHEFKDTHNILSVSLEDRQNQITADIAHYSEFLRTAKTKRKEQQARLQRLEALAGESIEEKAAAFPSPTITPILTEVRSKLSEEAALAEKYGDAWPALRNVRSRITALREQLSDEIKAQIQMAKADLKETAALETSYESLLREANEAGLALNKRESDFNRLHDDRENHKKIFTFLLERTTETTLSQMLKESNIRIRDEALAPKEPVSPKLWVNLGSGALLGLVFGVGLALLLSRLDRRLKDAKEIEEMGVPVIGVLPSMADMEMGGNKDFVAHTEPRSFVSENCRNIRTNLMFLAMERPLETLAITSANPEEGKTTVTINLAISFAQSGKRVLIVETDLRRPRLAKSFDLPKEVGVTNVLLGGMKLSEAVHSTHVPNLSVLACGPIPPNPSELLHHAAFAKLIGDTKSMFDFVIFDTPPLGAVTDAAIIGKQVDGTMLVAKADQTSKDAFKGIVRQLRALGTAIVGATFNAFVPIKGYNGGYTYYYAYRKEGYYGPRPEEAEESRKSKPN